MLKSGASDNFKKEKGKMDRESRKDLKSMDVLGKLAVEEEKNNAEDDRTKERIMQEILKQSKKDEKDLDMKGLDALVKLAISQSKKEKSNDEEG